MAVLFCALRWAGIFSSWPLARSPACSSAAHASAIPCHALLVALCDAGAVLSTWCSAAAAAYAKQLGRSGGVQWLVPLASNATDHWKPGIRAESRGTVSSGRQSGWSVDLEMALVLMLAITDLLHCIPWRIMLQSCHVEIACNSGILQHLNLGWQQLHFLGMGEGLWNHRISWQLGEILLLVMVLQGAEVSCTWRALEFGTSLDFNADVKLRVPQKTYEHLKPISRADQVSSFRGLIDSFTLESCRSLLGFMTFHNISHHFPGSAVS